MKKAMVAVPDKQSTEEITKEQMNYHFYKEYCRLYIAQKIMEKELEKIKRECDVDYTEKLNQHSQAQREYSSSLDMISRKEKRRRRTALEIERKYLCKYDGCPKSYGSEGSLNQHMK